MFVRECYFGNRFLGKNFYFYYSKMRVAVLRKSPAKNGIRRLRTTVEGDC